MVKSFGWAMNGLKTVWKEERNFRLETFAMVLVIALAFIFHFSTFEWVAVLFAIIIVLSGEIVNTAVEDICNKIQPNQDPVIGKIKDIMAGYVFLTSLGSAAVGIIIFFRHFQSLFF
ncbi:MAG: diacylglycerol kinase family protein [Candidatus Taylorbacteria bacterium]|nr:diacylglycerol kinase family protein [Candidatus Taylorbacteria bacterium]